MIKKLWNKSTIKENIKPKVNPPKVIFLGNQKYLQSKIVNTINIELKIVPENIMKDFGNWLLNRWIRKKINTKYKSGC